MKLKNRGKSISKVEVLNISSFGIWILVRANEYFLAYKDFPWFKKATLKQIQNVKLLHGHHLFWPELDVDLHLESLSNLEKYSLVYQ
ncbi:MAG: DUF2442 domain-containing protein [Candidatus Omnitrophica bacterium]|nr:DUF2442 domain-containing protein [Candidatus Omnitrophota bacterium]MCB9747824.1 DUF2442 domain-containing protein [Candidatus Omnitrophota bacterium]